MKLLTVLCFVLASSSASIHKECSPEDLGNCFITVEQGIRNTFHSLNGNQTHTNFVFCKVVLENEGQCVNERVEACKGDHPKASELMSSVNDYYHFLCANDAKIFQDFYICVVNEYVEYLKCSDSKDRTQEPDRGMWTNICTGNSSEQHCVAKFFRDTCKIGQVFDNFVANIIRAQADLKAEVCMNRSEGQTDQEAHVPMNRAEGLEQMKAQAVDYLNRSRTLEELKAEAVVYTNRVQGVEEPLAIV